MLNFPDNPARGDLFTPMEGQVWVWTGGWWDLVPGQRSGFVDAPENGITYGRKDVEWWPAVPIEGGQLAGPLDLPGDPTQPQQASNQNYVEQQITDIQGTVNATLPNYVTYAHLGAYYYTAAQSEQRMVDWYNAAVAHANAVAAGIGGATGARWIYGGSTGGGQAPPFILSGSHGPMTYVYHMRALQVFMWGGWHTVGFS